LLFAGFHIMRTTLVVSWAEFSWAELMALQE
jgi:hypothetical protein